MAVPQDYQSARSLVEKIANDHGYVSEEKLWRMGPDLADLRRDIEEALLKKDLLIGSTVITLSKNLYTSKARFVFELLQNADDNQYKDAIALEAVPYVSFRVYPHKITLECNEDGFKPENLVAICSIHVQFYDEGGDQTSSATYSVARPHKNHATLSKTKVSNGKTENKTTHFHVTKHEATNLAKNKNRSYSRTEETARAYSRSQVVLAFPLSETSTPITETQDLFVFLPVRPFGFKFLIQADFVTDAARQDIVKDSLRNHSLLDGIADAFVKAVLQFCEHDTLRYQWMRYLPHRNNEIRDTLFTSLVKKIADRLSNMPTLFGRKRPDLRLIRYMHFLDSIFLDEYGQPLLDDEESDSIISQQYDNEDLVVLHDYGLTLPSFSKLNQWLEQDLARDQLSRMKSPETSESWHARVAKLFHRPFKMKQTGPMASLMHMPLLPLQDGTWAPAAPGPVYFAQVDGINIPSDIGLRLISRHIVNADRKSFFKAMGLVVCEARPNSSTIYVPLQMSATLCGLAAFSFRMFSQETIFCNHY